MLRKCWTHCNPVFPSAKNLMAGITRCYEEGAFRLKRGLWPPELDEDSERAQRI